MTPQQIVGLAVRLFSIWLLFIALQLIGSGVSINSQPGIEASKSYFVIAAIVFWIAIALWFFPMFIAHKLIPRTKFENVLQVPANDAAMVACVILGLWLFSVNILPSLAHYVSLAVLLNADGKPLASSREFTVVRLGPVAIELIVAAILCFKAHVISKFFTTDRRFSEEE